MSYLKTLLPKLQGSGRWIGLSAVVTAVALVMAVPLVVEAGTGTPSKPQNLKGVVYHNKVELDWDAPGRFPEGSKYRVFKRTVGQQNWTQVGDNISETEWTHNNNPSSKQKFLYRVAAYKESNESRFSNNFKAIVPANQINHQQRWKSHSLKAYNYGSDGIKLKWQIRSTLGVTGYIIERRVLHTDDVETFNKSVPVPCPNADDLTCYWYDRSDEPFYFDKTAERNVKYSYRVKVTYDHDGVSGDGDASAARRIRLWYPDLRTDPRI